MRSWDLPPFNLRTGATEVKAAWYSGRVAQPASIGEARRRLPPDFLTLLGSSFPQPAAERILRGMGARRPVTLRVNTLRSDAASLMRFLRDNAVKHQRVPWYPDAFILTDLRERDVQGWPAYDGGGVYLQSLSSMIPALALAPAPGEHVLDAAAAPGSKTTQMAALMGNDGRIVANDVDPVRAERLAYNVRVQGCSIVETRVGRGERLGELMPAAFDRVLLDVPCSGEGRFIVHEPATTRPWSLKTVAECTRLQRKLLASGAAALKPGGVLVYSTCTLNLEENERMVDWALASLPIEAERIPVAIPGAYAGMARGLRAGVGLALRIFPDAQREGFFVCRMRKAV
jgi:NOL1/NOP2/sun family putative RNA methylase